MCLLVHQDIQSTVTLLYLQYNLPTFIFLPFISKLLERIKKKKMDNNKLHYVNILNLPIFTIWFLSLHPWKLSRVLCHHWYLCSSQQYLLAMTFLGNCTSWLICHYRLLSVIDYFAPLFLCLGSNPGLYTGRACAVLVNCISTRLFFYGNTILYCLPVVATTKILPALSSLRTS